MQIRSSWAAQALDIAAAQYIQQELIKREGERERRDREFWIVTLGGEPSSSPEITVTEAEPNEDAAIQGSILAKQRQWQPVQN